MKILVVTPKKAREHIHKIKGEMEKIVAEKQQHDFNKANRPTQLSLVDHMNAKGMLSHWTARRQMAEKFGINPYHGTTQQNSRLLAILQSQNGTNDNNPK